MGGRVQRTPTFEIKPEMTPSEVFGIVKKRSLFVLEATCNQADNCINEGFTKDVSIDMRILKISCVGEFDNIVMRSYHRVMKELFDAFLALFQEQIEPFGTEYRDESIYFISLLDTLIQRDLAVVESMPFISTSLKYHVDPRKFRNLMEIINDDLADFDAIFQVLKRRRNKFKTELKERFIKREKELEAMADS